MREPAHEQPGSPADYRLLKDALAAAQGDLQGLTALLSRHQECIGGWIAAAYEDLRTTLVQGRIGDGAELSGLIGTVLQLQARAHQGAFATDHELHLDAVQGLLDGIAAINDQDYEIGVETLHHVAELACAAPVRWLAWHWIGRASSELGDLDDARVAAENAVQLAAGLPSSALGTSLRDRAEIAFQHGRLDEALEGLAAAIAVSERNNDIDTTASALLARAQMQAVAGDVTGAIESATRARQKKPNWEQPVVFLARQALAEGQIAQAAWVLQLYYQHEPRPAAIQRELKLVELALSGDVPADVVCEYTRLRDYPPADETIDALTQLLARAPSFTQLRELLAWTQFKRGYDEQATGNFEELALEDVDTETRNSVLLGLGCLANRRNRHRQLGARLYAARSAVSTLGPRSHDGAAGDARPAPPGGRDSHSDALPRIDTEPGERGNEHLTEFDEVSSLGPSQSSVGSLRRLRANATTRPAGKVPTAPKLALTGDLSLFALPDLLEFLRTSRRSGTLVVTAEEGIGVVQLRQGLLAGAASPNSPSIGGALVEIGAITEGQLSRVAKEQQEGNKGRLLGELLVEKGLVTKEQIEAALAAQATSAIAELVAWNSGCFAFDPDGRADLHLSEIELELDTQAVLLDALRNLDERRRPRTS